MTYPVVNATSEENIHPAMHNAVVNVKANYNALGDDSTDDTSAFEAACQSNTTVLVPPGTYRVSNWDVTSKTNLTIVGMGGAVIKGPGGANGIVATFTTCDDLRISGLTFDANAITSFGGVRFYDCSRVWVEGNRYYDSGAVAPGATDRYSFVFTKTTDNNTDVHICGNVIEDLQLEVDHCTGATICHNKVYRSTATAGIGVFSTATGSPSVSDYDIHDNLIVNAQSSAGAITLNVDPVGTDNVTIQRMKVHDNTILFTGTTTPKRAVLVGTTDNTSVSTGCTFADIDIHDNSIIYAGGSFSGASIFFNSSTTTTITFERCSVEGNKLYGTGAGDGIDLRRFDNGTVIGNRVTNFNNRVNVGTASSASYADLIGTGSPEAAVTAGVGSVYHRTDGAGDTTIYTKTSGTTNTGWTAVDNV